MEKLDVGVEEVTLSDVDALEAELVDKLEDAGSDGGLADGGDIGVGTEGGLVFEDDAVEFRDVELVGGGTRGDGEGEALTGEDGVGEAEDEGFDN